MFERLLEVAREIRLWCDERLLDTSGIVLHYHPRWRYDLLKESKDYGATYGFSGLLGAMDEVYGLPVIDDGDNEDQIAVTIEQNDSNYRYLYLYDEMPRAYDWKKGQESDE